MRDRPRNVVLVGHCGPDMFMLRNAVGRVVPEAPLESVNYETALAGYLSSESVLLVNRELDGRFPETGGIEFIRRVAAADDAPVCVLISNFADAQEQAVAAGARPGFGKRDLYDEETARILRDAVRA